MRDTIFALTALAFSTATGGKVDPKQELNVLAGTWRVVTVEIAGKVQPAGKSPNEIVIAGNKLTGIGPEMIMTLDPAKNPKWVNLTFKKAGKEYPIRAIYEIDGDDLKICIPMAAKGKAFDNKRPKSFDTAGKGRALFKAKRTVK